MGVSEGEAQPLRILLDTNIILDFALERQPFQQNSEQVFLLAEQAQIEGFVSASTMSDLHYIIRKQKGQDWSLDFLKRLVTVCQVATVDQAVIERALNANFRDFEDAIQYSTAITNQLEAIVTRNSQDFPAGDIQILTPTELIQQLSISPQPEEGT